jgi:hypothetical protein
MRYLLIVNVKSYRSSARYLSMVNIKSYRPQKLIPLECFGDFLAHKLSNLCLLSINGKWKKLPTPKLNII